MALKVGIQMYSVREAMQKNPIQTIGKVAQLGYRYIELANLNAYEDFGCGFHAKPEELNNRIKPYGAEIIGAHIYPFDMSNIDAVLEYHAKLGTKYIMSKNEEVDRDMLLRNAEKYNAIGEKCREYGIQHCYHNGLVPRYDNGENLLEVLIANTSPETMQLELDTYWTQRSGLNPIELIQKNGDRIVLVHQKDIPEKTKSPLDVVKANQGKKLPFDKFYDFVQKEDFVEVGTGIMDLQGIIDAAVEYSQANYIVLEQDFTAFNEFESIKKSMEGFRRYKNILWE